MNPEPPPMNLLITGAAKRMGAYLAQRFSDKRYGVLIHYHRSHDAAQELAASITENGGRCWLLQADLQDKDQCKNLIASAIEKCGTLHALVNNAAVFEYDRTTEFSRKLFDAHMHANVAAPIELINAYYPHCVSNHLSGVAINILDYKLQNPNPDFFSYTLSKSSLATATQLMAMEMAPYLRVCGVAPGLCLPSPYQSQERFEQIHDQTPLKRGATPDDVYEAVNYLIHAPACTGEVINVDGGEKYLPRRRDVSFLEDDS